MFNFRSFFSSIPPVTKNLIIINFIVWFALLVFSHRVALDINDIGAIHYFGSPLFKPFQLITYMFIHANFTHLFFNMFALFMFGITLERVLGSKKFLFYFISCGIGAALVQEGVFAIYINSLMSKAVTLLDTTESSILEIIKTQGADAISQGMNFSDPLLGRLNGLYNVGTVGASGAVYGILLAFGMIFHNQAIYMMFIPIPIKAKYFVIGYGVIELLQGLAANSGDNVAHFAHLGGMIIGFLIILYWKKNGTLFNRF
ncbi:MAG: rhomboid family intramembrane serine protease [Muribaculaceae bacterium]|nr:rhomboid family intramembrane serine protease [Muribaculaceae bacterium]